MIIKKLRLENFGVYVGLHEIDLMPASRDKPIVLFGGLNGGGKTTLLDAVQLALFGKLSRCSTRGNLAYDEFLRRCISHVADPGSGASVAIEIRQTFDGEAHEFAITRRWTPSGKGLSESLVVHRDNVVDPELTEHWLEHVDQFVPVGLAELFFFDGEQIARLAESDNSAQMLTTAINTLLGIDLVDRLEKDLTIYERDAFKNLGDGNNSKEVTELENRLSNTQEALEKLLFESGKIQNELDQSQAKVEAAESQFKRQGGELFQRRTMLRSEKDAIGAQMVRLESELREIASGAAPLLLVDSQIAIVTKQAELEEKADIQRVMLTELERRDRNILGRLGRRKEFKQACLILESLFSEDRELRTKSSLAVRYLNLERSELQSVQRLTKSSLEEIRRKAIKLIQEHSLLNEKVLRLDETLGTVPDEAAIAHLTEQLALAQKEHYRKQAESSLQNEKVEQLRRSIGDQEREMTTILERRISERSESEDVTRKIKFSGRVRETMKLFRIKVLERKIRQIEALILESFQQLLRKKELVTAIRIDPQTYRMTLLGENGSELHADRLSAGERQLLAVSTLWGLARASGRPLPTIIDTPLGRLDSHHRANLVNSYFPYASHQVIILSTDEEIGKTHLAALKPRITRTFELSYSSATKSTEVIQGYFFN